MVAQPSPLIDPFLEILAFPPLANCLTHTLRLAIGEGSYSNMLTELHIKQTEFSLSILEGALITK